jgi:hypothetical protein
VARQYAYLLFLRQRFTRVLVDGVEVAREGARISEAVAAQVAYRHAQGRDAAVRAEADRAAWAEFSRSVGREPVVQDGVAQVRLLFPGGTKVRICRADQVNAVLRHEFEVRSGKVPVDQATAEQAWLADHSVSLDRVRNWTALWAEAGTEVPLEVDLSAWRHGAPLAGIAAVLTSYATAGWDVVAVHEDRGLYDGADANEESYPTRMRYLLARDVALGK